jgi:ADP-ribose pyrophosphatase
MRTIYEGRVFSVEVGGMTFPNGRTHEVAVVRHRPSVVLIPMRDDHHVVLIRQYRPAIDKTLWELPAGTTDPGESPDTAAARECEEEIGLVPQKLERLGGFFPTPGFCDEELIFYRASDLREPSGTRRGPDEDEDIQPKVVTVAEARSMVARGDIIDLKTAFGLTLI